MTVPSGWKTINLNKLVDVLDSKRIPVSAAERKHREGSVPYYGATGQVGTIDEPLFDEPLILLGEDGVQFFDASKPKAYYIDGPSWVNNHAHVLRPKKELVEFGYLLHYLNAFDYHGYANGTTRLKLTQGAMNSIPVHLPSLVEQKRIVEALDDHLSRLDEVVRYLLRAETLLSAMKRSIFEKFGQQINDAPEFPILDLCDVYQPRTIAVKELVPDGTYPVYGANGQIGFYNEFNHEDSEVTVTCRGATCGAVNVIPEKSWITGNAMVVRPKSGQLSKDFLELYLRGLNYNKVITGTAQPQITRQSMASLRLALPSIADQLKAVSRAQEVLTKHSALGSRLEDSLRNLNVLRRSLLHSALEGKLIS